MSEIRVSDMIEAESVNDNDVIMIVQDGVNKKAKAKKIKKDFIEVAGIDEYDNTSTYAEGDYCIYNNKMYKCTTEISTAEDWTVAHWTETSIVEEIDNGGGGSGDGGKEVFIQSTEPTEETAELWIDTDELIPEESMVVNSLEGNETTKAPSVNIAKQTFVGTTLWENTSTSSSFAGQSITLANSIENYSYYEVLHKDGSDECYLTSGKIPVNKLVRLIDICSGVPHYRNVTALSGTSITFDNCVFPSTYNSSNINTYNSGCIPMKVIGYK